MQYEWTHGRIFDPQILLDNTEKFTFLKCSELKIELEKI